MFRKNDCIDTMFDLLKNEGVDYENFNNGDLEKVKALCNQKDCILWINNAATLKPVFINDYGKNYYGFKDNELTKYGFDLYETFIHPDHFEDVRRTINFFTQHKDSTHRMTYLVKSGHGGWKWTYSIAKPLNYNNLGHPEYVLALVFDIEELVDRVVDMKVVLDNDFERANMAKAYDQLTKRERQVMHLIANEYTSPEIAETLFIQSSTVDSHRKHIIGKLGVKSSLGLVKYSLMFPLES